MDDISVYQVTSKGGYLPIVFHCWKEGKQKSDAFRRKKRCTNVLPSCTNYEKNGFVPEYVAEEYQAVARTELTGGSCF